MFFFFLTEEDYRKENTIIVLPRSLLPLRLFFFSPSLLSASCHSVSLASALFLSFFFFNFFLIDSATRSSTRFLAPSVRLFGSSLLLSSSCSQEHFFIGVSFSALSFCPQSSAPLPPLLWMWYGPLCECVREACVITLECVRERTGFFLFFPLLSVFLLDDGICCPGIQKASVCACVAPRLSLSLSLAESDCDMRLQQRKLRR